MPNAIDPRPFLLPFLLNENFNPLLNETVFSSPTRRLLRVSFNNIVVKRENICHQNFLFFPQSYLPFETKNLYFQLHLYFYLQTSFIWTSLKFCCMAKTETVWRPFNHYFNFIAPASAPICAFLEVFIYSLFFYNYSAQHSSQSTGCFPA